jgi:hypothetical protein
MAEPQDKSPQWRQILEWSYQGFLRLCQWLWKMQGILWGDECIDGIGIDPITGQGCIPKPHKTMIVVAPLSGNAEDINVGRDILQGAYITQMEYNQLHSTGPQLYLLVANIGSSSKFIQWMLQEEAQQYMAVKEGFPVTLSSIYKDKYVQAWNPLFALLNQPPSSSSQKSLLDTLLDNAQLRPTSTYYPQMANAIELRINDALARLDSPEQALQKLQTDLESIVSHPQQTQKFVCAST